MLESRGVIHLLFNVVKEEMEGAGVIHATRHAPLLPPLEHIWQLQKTKVFGTPHQQKQNMFSASAAGKRGRTALALLLIYWRVFQQG